MVIGVIRHRAYEPYGSCSVKFEGIRLGTGACVLRRLLQVYVRIGIPQTYVNSTLCTRRRKELSLRVVISDQLHHHCGMQSTFVSLFCSTVHVM